MRIGTVGQISLKNKMEWAIYIIVLDWIWIVKISK